MIREHAEFFQVNCDTIWLADEVRRMKQAARDRFGALKQQNALDKWSDYKDQLLPRLEQMKARVDELSRMMPAYAPEPLREEHRYQHARLVTEVQDLLEVLRHLDADPTFETVDTRQPRTERVESFPEPPDLGKALEEHQERKATLSSLTRGTSKDGTVKTELSAKPGKQSLSCLRDTPPKQTIEYVGAKPPSTPPTPFPADLLAPTFTFVAYVLAVTITYLRQRRGGR